WLAADPRGSPSESSPPAASARCSARRWPRPGTTSSRRPG
ncbi:MAG: Ketopantoate reductase PanG, partial [uncultured Pseudonocardia sp.]